MAQFRFGYLFFLVCILGHGSDIYASAIPTDADCEGKIRITKIESISKVRYKRVSGVLFEVVESNCDFLKQSKTYESSSIDYKSKEDASLELDKTYSGDFAQGSTMGPGGVVPWIVFLSPGYPGFIERLKHGPYPSSPKNGFEFTFSPR